MKITQGKINELLTEPGCEHNQHKQTEKKNKSCAQQAQPGAAQGGCAFDGAMISLVPITDAAHLVHGPSLVLVILGVVVVVSPLVTALQDGFYY